MKFHLPRVPYDNDQQDQMRTQAYWTWLQKNDGSIKDNSFLETTLTDGKKWVRLLNANDADYEASFMGHSIGHSWDKYSKFGDIYSLRSVDNHPLATILVSNNSVVHAKEHNNANLSQKNNKYLQYFCTQMNFKVSHNDHSFDYYADEEKPNTGLRYFVRVNEELKIFEQCVLKGQLSAAQIEIMKKHSAQIDCKHDKLVCIPGYENVECELQLIYHTDELPNVNTTSDEFYNLYSQRYSKFSDELTKITP